MIPNSICAGQLCLLALELHKGMFSRNNNFLGIFDVKAIDFIPHKTLRAIGHMVRWQVP